MTTMGPWLTSLRRVSVPIVTFALGAYVKLEPSQTFQNYFAGGIIILALFVIEEYFTNIRPTAQLNEIVPIAMDTAAGPLIARLKANGVEVRMSVFKVTRPVKALFLKRQFKMTWNIKMNDYPDVNLSFPATDGVSGQCLKQKKVCFADESTIEAFPLSPKLRERLGDNKLKAVVCCPVYEAKRRGRKQSGKIVGVLNLDSFDPNAHRHFMDPTNRVTDSLRELAGLASHILV